MFVAFQQTFEDVAFVHLRIADEGDEAAKLVRIDQILRCEIILRQRGKRRHRHPEADRAGGDIDVVNVFGARGIGLHAAEGTEGFQLFARLQAHQILYGMEHRRGMRLHRHTVFRFQHSEIERREDRIHRRGGRLMPADLHRIVFGAQMIGVVDRPGGKPENLPFQFLQNVAQFRAFSG